ncbi:hypothetical protein AB835_12070 [Candidatus Endobugula sertula]|uniref:Uncharacterized protein n=1 Tax=Candidatus Endobugula sertula TaxID=62101 RepID=A0A1D2QML2_9GAMM|nr:hypothetical protein AB835_12070 [Candidatus Endobugula sertula]
MTNEGLVIKGKGSGIIDESLASLNTVKRDYLAEYDTAMEEDKYPLVRRWMKEEPLPFFKQLREERPVLVTPECTLLASSTDVKEALQLPNIFTTRLYQTKMGVTDTDPGYMTAHDDNALHHREKSIMKAMLNRVHIPLQDEHLLQLKMITPCD